MKQVNNVWLPDRENHFQAYLNNTDNIIDGRGTYHFDRFQKAIQHVEDFGDAIDIGAHVGLWATHMVKKFKQVHMFEPDDENMRCLVKNIEPAREDCETLYYQVALGKEQSFVGLERDSINSGKTHIDTEKVEYKGVSVRSLDEFNLNPDFIKIDVEGYELFVLQGAKWTITNNKPIIVMEDGPPELCYRYGIKTKAASEFLVNLGYDIVDNIRHDYIFVHGDK